MILAKILSSYTFRAALATVLGISIVVLIVMLVVYSSFLTTISMASTMVYQLS